MQTDYLAAVADAAVSDASEVYRDLPCIVSPDSGDGLEWTERGGRQFVLVCSMTDGEYAGVWTAGRQFVTVIRCGSFCRMNWRSVCGVCL